MNLPPSSDRPVEPAEAIGEEGDRWPAAPDPESHHVRTLVERLCAEAKGRESSLESGQVPTAGKAPEAGASAGLPEQIGGWQVEQQLGCGGMGVVYQVRDCKLNRSLALKVLRGEHRDKPGLRQRFLEEAQIMGQLQHPGVAPIHELGELGDGRPFFVMRQIKGRTLAQLLQDRPAGDGASAVAPAAHAGGPGEDLPRRLGVFEQVCQTVAFAHSRRIIHRDLKPHNVMVGRFGEVQVLDWGLAKVLDGTESRHDAGEHTAPVSTIVTIRSGLPESSDTAAGTVLGTPAYMAPEQARGEVERLDARADVFALGAILCEVLTGRPPFAAASGLDSHRKAMKADTADALAALGVCGADAELVQLARWCLAAEKEDRPGNAGEVVQALADHRTAVQERLRRIDIERAEARIKAAEDRKRRKLRQALAAVVAVFVLVLAGAAVRYYQQEAAHAREEAHKAQRLEQLTRDLDTTLAEVDRQQERLHAQLADPLEAAKLLSDIDGWKFQIERMRQAWKQGEAIWQSGRDLLGEDWGTRLAALDRQLAADEHDWDSAKQLDDIRLGPSVQVNGKWDLEQVAPRYARAFAKLGLAVERGEPTQVAALVRRRRIRPALVAALDHWARVLPPRDKLLPRILEIARQADPDPWGNQVRDAATWANKGKLLALAGKGLPERTTPQLVLLLAYKVRRYDRTAAAGLVRHAALVHPRDFWLFFELGFLVGVSDPAEYLGCCQAAVLLRPGNAGVLNNLGHAFHSTKNYDGAIHCFRKALQLDPNYEIARRNLAVAHHSLGNSLFEKQDFAGAVRCHQKAVQADPTNAHAYSSLAWALCRQGNPDGALVACKKALAQNLSNGGAAPGFHHYVFGEALRLKGDLDGALAAYQESMRLGPSGYGATWGAGQTQLARGRFAEAVYYFQRTRELILAHKSPVSGGLMYEWAEALRRKGDLDGALAAYRESMRLAPTGYGASWGAGQALSAKGRFTEAAIYLHMTRQLLLAQKSAVPPDLLKQLATCEKKVQDLDRRLVAILRGEASPRDAAERIALAQLCGHSKKLYAPAVRFYSEGFAADPKLAVADDLYDAAHWAVLAAQQGKGADPPGSTDKTRLRGQALGWLQRAMSALEQQLGSEPTSAATVHFKLGHWLRNADLTGVRDGKGVAQLPEAERRQWQQLWGSCAALFVRSGFAAKQRKSAPGDR
jgi:serine/threonine-protein kinase